MIRENSAADLAGRGLGTPSLRAVEQLSVPSARAAGPAEPTKRRRRSWAARAALPLVVLALAGCGGLPSMDAVTGKQTRDVTVSVSLDDELLRVTLPSHGRASARVVTLRQSGVNGAVETWSSQSGLSISLDRGVVVATRGFGFDLMGANADPTLSALEAQSDAVHRRHMRYLTADNHSVWLQAGCQIEASGPDAKTGLSRIEERCKASSASFTNIYWTDDSGRILRSRQWIAPELGYLEIQAVR